MQTLVILKNMILVIFLSAQRHRHYCNSHSIIAILWAKLLNHTHYREVKVHTCAWQYRSTCNTAALLSFCDRAVAGKCHYFRSLDQVSLQVYAKEQVRIKSKPHIKLALLVASCPLSEQTLILEKPKPACTHISSADIW